MKHLRRIVPVASILLLAAPLALGCGSGEAGPQGSDEPAAAPVAAGTGEGSEGASAPEGSAPAAAGTPAAQSASEPVLEPSDIPDVVARIDGREVTREDLLARATEARGALAERGIPAPAPTRAFYRKVVDDLIGNALVYRKLAGEGKAASEEEIDRHMAAIRGQFDSDEAFESALAERGFDVARLRRDVAETITVRKWMAESIAPTIEVTDDELRELYEANREQMVEPEKVRARHVLVSVPAGANEEQKGAARSEAEGLRQRIAGGEDFAAVAREASDDPGSGPRGGDLGWFYRGQMVPPFDAAAFSLEPGTLSQLVETRFGFHILEVQEHVDATKLEFEDVSEQLRQRVQRQKLERAVLEAIDELGKAAEVEIYL